MSRIGLAALAFLCIALSPSALGATGRTPGAFNVSPSGAGTYTIPIWAPPGPRGIQPNIALSYNSQAGNGYLGVGWNLSGLSSIYRCNLTFAQDAAPAEVTLATSDGYCLDGQRLRLTGGTYGTAGSTYQTEIANFVQVTAYGSQGNGPSYFVAQMPNGQTWTYGNPANGSYAQVIATGTSTASMWMLNEVQDPPGNTMTIVYCPTGTTGGANCPSSALQGTTVPSTISWTPTSHGATTYGYTMQFNWGSNVLPPTGYIGGTIFKNPYLLGSIQIEYSSAIVKYYALTYAASGTTSRDTLTSVQECDSATVNSTNCLLATSISYQSGAVGVQSSTIGTTVPGSSSVRYDFNGDGKADLAYVNNGIWWVAFATSGGFQTAVSTGVSASSLYTVGSLSTKGGEDGFLVDNSGTWYYYSWNGSSFTGVSTGLAVPSAAYSVVLADTNGDGLRDIVVQNGTAGTESVYLNTTAVGQAPSATFSSTPGVTTTGCTSSSGCLLIATWATGRSRLKTFDFDGDGREDIIEENLDSGATQMWLARGTTFVTNGTRNATIFGVGNFNGDNCTDYVEEAGSSYTLVISPCDGTPGSTIALSTAPIAYADMNGDGLTDLVYCSSGYLAYQYSTGSGLTSTVNSTVPCATSGTVYSVTDQDGDGLDDLVSLVAKSGAMGYHLHNSPGVMPDLATKFQDGYGNTVSPTYVDLIQDSNYNENWWAGSYPDVNYIGPLYIANEAVFSDPSNPPSGTYNLQYSYYSAWWNLQGRGFDGFRAINRLDSRNDAINSQYYGQAFPYTGLPYQNVKLVQGDSSYLSEAVGTTADTVLSSATYEERYFPYISNWTAYRWEYGDTENGDLITTTSTSYTYDDYGNATNITKTVTDNDPGSPYVDDTWTTTTTNTTDVNTTTWCLRLFTETQVEYTASINGSGNITLTKNLTPDTTNCRYTQVVTAPSTAYQVTEAFGFDSFGNIDSDVVTGTGMTARTTSATWSNSTYTTGQFPLSVTDPSSAETQYTYNYSFGEPQTVTDPNGLVTTWPASDGYDGFGRPTVRINPDGTYTEWQYQNCSAIGCPLSGQSQGLYINSQHYQTNGSTIISSGTDWRDSAERPLMLTTNMIVSGDSARNEVRYDSLGRKAQQAAPCVYSSPGTSCTFWTTTTYDVLNRPVSVTRPVNSGGQTPTQTTSYTYAGRTTTISDPYSYTKTIVKDVNGWLRETKDAYGYTVTLAYDQAGSETSVSDSAATLWSGTYAYGIAPLNLTASDVDLGAWSYTHDALGELTSWKDAKSQSFSQTYDALSRPLTRKEPDYFTQWTWGSSATSHNIGQLQSVCTGLGANPTACTSSGYSEAETYDSVARPYQRAITIPSSGTYTYTLTYNSATGLPNTLTYPTSTSGYAFELQYGYQNGILNSLTDISDSPNVTVWKANTNNAAEQITEETLGNGIVTNRTYDAVTHWLSSVQSGVGSGSGVQNQAFLFDEMGDVTQRQDNNLGLTENIYYDNAYRLTSSKLGGTTNLSITYAANGNISSRSDVASGATWTYDTTHLHVVDKAGSSSYQYSYDANGNAITRQGNSITWASYNYATAISAGSGSTAESVTLAYGPGRQRWSQYYTGNSTTEQTYYVGGLMEVVGTGGVTSYRHYLYAGTEPIGVYTRTSTLSNTFDYFLSDHQGSVASITNNSGGVVVPESFTPFGARRNPTTWSGADSTSDLTTSAAITRQAYTFQTQLGLWMGMNHMNGRVQDDVTGRFLSPDPNIPHRGNAQSYNRYSYALNNPLTYVDPSGFDDVADPVGDDGGGGGNDGGTLPEIIITGTQPADPADTLPEITITGTQPADPADTLPEITITGAQPMTTLPGVTVTAKRPMPSIPVMPQTQQKPCMAGPSNGPSTAAANSNGASPSANSSGPSLGPFVGWGALGIGALGSAVVGGALASVAVPAAMTEGGGMWGVFAVVDAAANSAMFGLGVGGPYGALAGTLLGAGAYAVYSWTHSTSAQTAPTTSANPICGGS